QPDGRTQFVPQHQTDASLNMTLSQKLPVVGGDLFVSSALARVTVAGQQSLETWSSTPVSIGLAQDIFRPNVVAWDRREQAARATDGLRLSLGLPAGTALQVAVSTVLPDFEADTARAVAEALRNRAAVSDVVLQDVLARRRVTEAKLASGVGATVSASFGLNATAAEASLAYQH